MVERMTSQLRDNMVTQEDLLDTVAARTRENNDLTSHVCELENQIHQEVSAKEYLGLELHKAEGLPCIAVFLLCRDFTSQPPEYNLLFCCGRRCDTISVRWV